MNHQFPRKLHIEITSRCNFTCRMCMKYSKGSDVGNFDLDYDAITSLDSVLPTLDALVLNGIGEPLLHPDLLQIISFARKHMDHQSWIGLQSNGALLTPEYAELLLEKGLNRLCLSLDSASDATAASQGHGIGHGEDIIRAFAAIKIARDKIAPKSFMLGVEIVLMEENVQELPELIDRAGRLDADFVIVSHLLPYQKEMERSCLFNPNTRAATKLFSSFRTEVEKLGLQLTPDIFPLWDNPHAANTAKIYSLYKEMTLAAKGHDVTQHLQSLMMWDTRDISALNKVYEQAEKIADRYQMQLDLPPLQASQQRDCAFVSNDACFITATGEVAPCNSLFHSYTCYMDGEEKSVGAKSFGNIHETPLLSIWQSEAYSRWREEVRSYGYPFCSSCALGPCLDVTNQGYPFAKDCYGYSVPCGHCLWNFGALRCL